MTDEELTPAQRVTQIIKANEAENPRFYKEPQEAPIETKVSEAQVVVDEIQARQSQQKPQFDIDALLAESEQRDLEHELRIQGMHAEIKKAHKDAEKHQHDVEYKNRKMQRDTKPAKHIDPYERV